MRTYSGNNLHTSLANLSTNPVPGVIAEIAEHDLDLVSGGKTTVKGPKITVKPNGEVTCSGGCTATVG